jgi:hypothetical protein
VVVVKGMYVASTVDMQTNSSGTVAFPGHNFANTPILLSSTHFNVHVYCMQCAVWARSVSNVNSFSHYNING